MKNTAARTNQSTINGGKFSIGGAQNTTPAIHSENGPSASLIALSTPVTSSAALAAGASTSSQPSVSTPSFAARRIVTAPFVGSPTAF